MTDPSSPAPEAMPPRSVSGRRGSAVWGWCLIGLLLYTVGTLAWLGRHGQARVAATLDHRCATAARTADQSVPHGLLSATLAPDNPALAQFTIPLPTPDLMGVAQWHFTLWPAADLGTCSVQVIAESDHHFSYSHVYPTVALSGQGFAFSAPLMGAAAASYWRPLQHPGQWTDWERVSLRRLAVKVFAKNALTGGLTLQYQAEASAPPAATTLAWATVLQAPGPLGERFELAFDLRGWAGNPFDLEALPVTLELTPPAGAAKRLRPFFTQHFEAFNTPAGEQLRPGGPKHFRVRFRPTVTGQHHYRLLARSPSGQELALTSGSFEVTPGQAPDFLRVSAQSPHYFAHADGRFFYPIGWNIPYPVDRPYDHEYVPYLPAKSLATARRLLDDLADAGGNFTRYWLSDWWNALEWHQAVDNYGGTGRYNLKNAWLNDQLLEHCERRGIYLQFETMNHVRLHVTYGWPQHPYNAANGGFLNSSDEFWQHPQAASWSRQRLAYIIARYGDSPAIHSWNVMSEPDVFTAHIWPQARRYILSQLAIFRELDPYGHIIGNQLCLPDTDLDFFREPIVQFVSTNGYAGGIGGLPLDQIPAVRTFAERYSQHRRPVLVAESVGHYAGDPAFKMRRDTLGALWSGATSTLAGTPQSWWWNFNYGEDLGSLYRVLADFMGGEDLIREDAAALGGWRHCEVSASSQVGNLRAQMVGNTQRRFLLLYNFETLARTRAIPSLCRDSRVSFAGLRPGAYRVEYWDLEQGQTAITQELLVGADGRALLQPPPMTLGWAVKVRPAAEAAPVAATAGPAASPQPAAPPAMTAPDAPETTPSETAADWSWRLLPQASIAAPAASERAVIEARIALPASCQGLAPLVTDAKGQPAPGAWTTLAEGQAWRLVLPATVPGPLTVRPGGPAKPPATAPDDNTWGLQLTVAEGATEACESLAEFDQRFKALSKRAQTRLSVIDQLENPLGDSEAFMAVYRGPLLAPVSGEYQFATNSDDASFVKINGKPVVAWPGAHGMEYASRPADNKWRRRGTVTLTAGLHWVEYYHQQLSGACLARLGWRLPASGTQAPVIAQPFASPAASDFAVVPAWALDGQVPCAVEIRWQDQVQLTLAPTHGLELRRPRTPIATLAIGDAKAPRFVHFTKIGHQWLAGRSRQVPVWAVNQHYQPFSLAWEAVTLPDGQPQLQTLSYDLRLPLRVQLGQRAAGEQVHAPGSWVAWPLTATDQGQELTIGLGDLPLLRAPLGQWLAPLSVQAPTSAPAKPLASGPLPPKITQVLEMGLVPAAMPLPTAPLAPWWPASEAAAPTVSWLRGDPWTLSPATLAEALAKLPATSAVPLRLDRRAILTGLSGAQVQTRWHALLTVIRQAGALPILVLHPELDLSLEAHQAMALAAHRLSQEFDCPLLDLRELAP